MQGAPGEEEDVPGEEVSQETESSATAEELELVTKHAKRDRKPRMRNDRIESSMDGFEEG